MAAWSEKPIPIQLDFTLYRMAEQAGDDPSLAQKQPYKAAVAKDYHWLGAAMVKHYRGDDSDMGQLMAAVSRAFVGMRVEESAAEVRDWVATGVVVRASDGLHPHDLARDVLDAEHAVRAPEQYRQLHQAIRAHVVERLRQATGPDRHQCAQALFHLHRKGPLVDAAASLRRVGGVARPAGPADVPAVLDMVRAVEGDLAAKLAGEWLAHQPEGLVVVEAPDGLMAYALVVLIDPALVGTGALPDDPVVTGLMPYLDAAGPTRPGELIHVGRFVGDVTGQSPGTAAVVAGSTASTLAWLTEPLSWAVVTGEEAFWAPLFAYLLWSTGDMAITEEALAGTGKFVAAPWRYERIEGAGHWMQLEAADQVNRLLLEFLGEAGPRA